jgi:hypothetical protein
MTDQDKNHLLEELLGDEELERVREASLSGGLREMRGRRHRALAGRVGLMMLPALMLAFVVFSPRFQSSHHTISPTAVALASKPESKVEFITTEQLFALFPNRSMALVGKPGHQQLIFLDGHSASDTQ